MRGRLIFQFQAEVIRLDRQAMATLEPGYDPDFKEPVLVDNNDDGVGERIRHEHPPIRIPCQVETKVFEDLQMMASGNAPQTKIHLVFHFKDLERMGLVDALTGKALMAPGDRLAALHDMQGHLVQAFISPNDLYVTEARPIGFGLNLRSPKRNLLLVTFEERTRASRRFES